MRRAAAAVSQVAHLHGRGPGVVPGLPISPRHACPAGSGAPPRTSSQPTSRHDSATTASPGPFQKPLRPHPKPPHICLAPGAAGAPAPAQGGASRSRPQRFLAEVRARPMRLGHGTEAQPPSGWQAVMSIPAQSGCMPRMLSDRGSKAEVDSLRRAGLPTEMGDRMKTPKRGARCVGRTRSPARRQNDLRWQSLTAGQGGGEFRGCASDVAGGGTIEAPSSRHRCARRWRRFQPGGVGRSSTCCGLPCPPLVIRLTGVVRGMVRLVCRPMIVGLEPVGSRQRDLALDADPIQEHPVMADDD